MWERPPRYREALLEVRVVDGIVPRCEDALFAWAGAMRAWTSIRDLGPRRGNQARACYPELPTQRDLKC